MNKINKTLGIIAGAMGGVLLILVAVLMIRGSRIGDIFDMNQVIRQQTTPEATEHSTNPVPETTTVHGSNDSTSSSAMPDTTTATEPPELQYSTNLRVGVSRLEGNFNPFVSLSEGDADVMKLVGISLLTRDRAGKIIMMATEGEYSYYNGERYLYTGPADISVDYDEENDETSFTLKLRDDIFFSDGVKLTVDDLIFNLYVRLQPNFQGEGMLRSYDIVGLKNYYYNNSLAENIEISQDEIWAELYEPGEEVSAFIRQTIANILREEARISKEIWTSYAALGYGESAEEFFFNLYGRDLNYNLLGKSLDEICEDVIDSYGMDFRALAEKYATNENYFDGMMSNYCREILLKRRMEEEGGEPVDYISGIVRLGDYTVKIRLHGSAGDSVYEFFDMVIAPLHYYGDPMLYDYDSHQFGFVRGQYEVPQHALEKPLGAGPYVFSSYDGNTVYLKKNENYYKAVSDIEFLSIRPYGEDVLDEITGQQLDIVVLPGGRANYEALCETNGNGQLTGDKLFVEEILDLGYSYIGINAQRIKVGGEMDSNSEASQALRRGILTAIAAFRESSYEEFFGGAARLIDYPVSPFFNLEPEEQERAFNRRLDGSPIYQESDDAMTRFNACLEAVKEYFIAAGYEYNEASGKFTQAPEGASLRYEIMLSGSLQDDHPSFGALAYAKSILYQLGISLDMRYVSSVDNMLVYLYLCEADLWCASWNCTGDPNFDLHYTTGWLTNLFSLWDDELNEMTAEFESIYNKDDREAVKELAARIMERVDEWAVELPCYNLCNYLVYNVNTIDVTTLPGGHSLYWTWMDDVAFLDVYPRVVEE